MSARLARRVAHRDESGQITVLIIGFAMIVALAIGVVANASNVFMQRRSLVSWADGAVTVAAQQLAHDQLYRGEPLETLPLSQDAARAAVADYAERNGLVERFDRFQVTSVSVDPQTSRVTVELAASVPLMLVGDVTSGLTSVTVTARSSAIVPLE